MKDVIQRFGAAMFVPVLLFPIAGIMLGISVILLNTSLFPFSTEGSTWFKVSSILMQGSSAVFKNMPTIFALGIPIALAKQASGRAVLATFVSYTTYNYIIGGILQFWGVDLGVDYRPKTMGLTEVGGVLTLDTSLLGAILVASVTVWVHNNYFNKRLPNWSSVFIGTPLVVVITIPIMAILAVLTCFIWPTVQEGIVSLQTLILSSGTAGVWIFTFLERILIPTGLHHFIYGSVFYGPVAVDGGTVNYWIQHMSEFSKNPAPLTQQFPAGGFMLTGMGKVFGGIGISLALYATARPENKKMTLGLMLGAGLTAALTGITEPLDFTFLFISPMLFFIHALLSATLAAITYKLGVSGNFQQGLIDFLFQNWLPLFSNHAWVYIVQLITGLCFTFIYFFLFRTIILKFDILTPGRDIGKARFHTQKEYREKNKGRLFADTPSNINSDDSSQAAAFIRGLGGELNIETLTNCATRLRVKVKEVERVQSTEYFQSYGAISLVRAKNNLQVIVGLTVPQLREEMMKIISQGCKY
ncbi:PTS transporter subunit EIIC [Serratia marcescens]|uniref:alpha-glucoside-specific PTS transporter subunit IIBC n=1 Tax=Serratia marcescens TaxID=615 RepID=UPI0018D68770|nr:PTS transporter subunit EIIC [Serratia marcescens]